MFVSAVVFVAEEMRLVDQHKQPTNKVVANLGDGGGHRVRGIGG